MQEAAFPGDVDIMDPEIQEALYDPKGKMTWKQFIAAHKSWRTPKGLLDLKRIAAAWKQYKQGKTYDPGVVRGSQKNRSTIPKAWAEAMYTGIKKSSDVRDPCKIVKAIWSKLSEGKKDAIRKQAAAGKTFIYNLPLPDDRPTRGTGTIRTVKPFNLGEVQINVSGKDFDDLKKSGLYDTMKREDGSLALVKRCKSGAGNCNIFVDKMR